MSECQAGYIEWIYKIFGNCVSTPREKVSFGVGMVSNSIWLICSIPQIYHNFKTKHVDGQSPFYFSIMVIADMMNLIGAIVNHALPTQIITGVIYVTVDFILLTQFTIYKGWPCQQKKDPAYETMISDNSMGQLSSVILTTATAIAVDYGFPYQGQYLWGSVSGWISAGLYLFSRVMQLKKNIEKKYITDFSPFYVFLIVSANLTYFSSVFIQSTEPQYLWNQLPWLVGSAGPMCFDIGVGIQMMIFGRHPPSQADTYNPIE